MGRLLCFALGGLALALYGPHLLLGAEKLARYKAWWIDLLTQPWYDKIFHYGPGIFAGLALLFLAIRSRDS
ncbi:MAG: hypothetical protein MUE73_11930 [Planctomycetes bacterium]|jgi:hypothetical protein|nr:hypothetical protein [Planctomycetota bacterium]